MKKAIVIIILSLSIYACKDVVNTIPDNTYVFGYDRNQLPPPNLPSDNPLTKEGVFLGRMLFYDPILSSDSTQSCASCHNQANAFTDNGERFSEGVLKTKGKRNSMPIFNMMWHLDGFFWDGRADILRHQAVMPIKDSTEMNETIPSVLAKLNKSPLYKQHFLKVYDAPEITEELLGKALEQFMLTIVSGASKFDKVEMGLATFTNQEKIGQIIFNEEAITIDKEIDPKNPKNFGADCFHCHGNSLFMRREFLNNGLPSNGDKGKGDFTKQASDNFLFKTPTLRNIEKTAPYMHDGRFNTLEEVVQFYLSPIKNSPVDISNSPNMHALKDSVYLSPAHKAALVSFLKTLTDQELLTKEEYSNPFK